MFIWSKEACQARGGALRSPQGCMEGTSRVLQARRSNLQASHRRPPRCRSRSAKACTCACISHQTHTFILLAIEECHKSIEHEGRKGDRREAVQYTTRYSTKRCGDDWPPVVGKTTAYATSTLRVTRLVTTLCSSRVLEMGKTKVYKYYGDNIPAKTSS